MITFIQDSNYITLPAPTGGVVSGGVYKIGNLILVATGDAAQTVEVVFARKGKFTVTKVGSQAWAIGTAVYWDNANTRFTTASAAGVQMCGFAGSVVAGGAGDTTGDVILDGTARLVV